jgi:hypothetical protein
MKPKLKPPGTKRLELKCDILLSTSAFKFNSRRYTKVAKKGDKKGDKKAKAVEVAEPMVGRCRLTL